MKLQNGQAPAANGNLMRTRAVFNGCLTNYHKDFVALPVKYFKQYHPLLGVNRLINYRMVLSIIAFSRR